MIEFIDGFGTLLFIATTAGFITDVLHKLTS